MTLPDGVEVIGEGAFYGCNLRSVDLPDSVTTMMSAAFAENEHLNHLKIGSGFVDTLWAKTDVEPDTIEKCYPEFVAPLKAAYPSFPLETLLNYLLLVQDYRTVLNHAPFENCYRLVEIENCSSNITITADGAENLGGIGKYARVLGVLGAGEKSKLSEQSADEGTYTVYTSDDGKVYVVDYFSDGGEKLDLASAFGTGYVVHDYAISNCLDFSSVDLSGCSEVGNYAFYREPNTLNSVTNPTAKFHTVTFGKDIAFIGAHAFQNCIGLTEVDLFECKNLTSIGDYAFAADKDTCMAALQNNIVFNLTTVYLGENVETIGEGAFEYCRAMQEVFIGTRAKSENTVGNASKLNKIGKDAFFYSFYGSGHNNKNVYFSGTTQQMAACVREVYEDKGGYTYVFGPSDKGTSVKIQCSDGSISA